MASSNTNNSSLPNTTFVQADPSTFRAVVQRLTGPDIRPRRPGFNLHQRRPTARNLEIKLNHHHHRGGDTASPVSPLEYSWVRGGGGLSPMEEEERAIAEKGFYLHTTPRGSDPPELLPLFPLHSPTATRHFNN